MKHKTVHQIRLSGKQVKISHLRRYYFHDPKTGRKQIKLLSFEEHMEKYPYYFLDALGGSTLLSITDNKNPNHSVSVKAECSILDRYNRKVGVRIALGRALEAFEKLSS